MADTLPNVVILENVWTDIYAATGISPGIQIKVQNLGTSVIRLNAGVATPVFPNPDAFVIVERGVQAINDTGDGGAWALSEDIEGLVSVRIAAVT